MSPKAEPDVPNPETQPQAEQAPADATTPEATGQVNPSFDVADSTDRQKTT